ncbi:hypothetical protein M1105_19935 [Limibaculum sp. FT325]|uniref:hypothetical protein n=1 Tax=Thermohalobaculum sediminis TaxID=2939436 RepID=UPI0020BEA30F|nr:hypothetical protein [Limibaculum sediminis]MCL5779235.1 hypothetical protein [Limibaculum sediminis]
MTSLSMRKAARCALAVALGAAALFWNGDVPTSRESGFIATAEALIGRPLTPMSYAGVARRTTVRAVRPGVGVGPNLGGPVNRVGWR